MSLYAFMVLGLFLLVVPWTPVWERVMSGWSSDTLGAWVRAGWVRGVVSGLGALDLVVAAEVGRELWHSLHLPDDPEDGR